MNTFLKSLSRSSRGASLTEYGILVGLVAVAAIGSVLALGKQINDSFDTAGMTLASYVGDGAAQGGAEAPVVVFSDEIGISSGLQHSASSRLDAIIDTAPWGYTSSNAAALHVSNAGAAYGGSDSLEIPTEALSTPGTYMVTFEVGNFSNFPFATFEVGLMSSGVFLTPLASDTPLPALGEKMAWNMTYALNQAQIDAGIIWQVETPTTSIEANASFDDLMLLLLPH